jgi:hypothetical protein
MIAEAREVRPTYFSAMRAPHYGLRKSSGNFAMFAAILRASSLLSSLAADRRPGSSSK